MSETSLTRDPFDPEMHPELYDGVLAKRIIAFLLDLVFMAIWLAIGVVVVLILAIPTLGLALLLLGGLGAIVYFLYIGLTLGSEQAATPGMKIMGLEMRLWHGEKPGFIIACFHALLFWFTVFMALVLLVSGLFALFNRRKRTLHDLVAGVIVLNRLREPEL